MNGSTIHHHENHSDKPNAGIKVNKNTPRIAVHVFLTPFLPKLPNTCTE